MYVLSDIMLCLPMLIASGYGNARELGLLFMMGTVDLAVVALSCQAKLLVEYST